MGGSQAYWVCPLIEESDPGSSNPRSRLRSRSDALQLKTALDTYEGVRATFPELRVGLVHGRLKSEDKGRVMEQFQSGEMRMGLSQLHHLRGRVGRGSGASTCILLYLNPLSPAARERLRIVFENDDGFEIARHDLRLRGPGELLGARQSGVPMLRFADLSADTALLEAARATAETMLRRHVAAARSHLARWLGERHELLKV
jgi:ATP-dependent DNA helicase RecG